MPYTNYGYRVCAGKYALKGGWHGFRDSVHVLAAPWHGCLHSGMAACTVARQGMHKITKTLSTPLFMHISPHTPYTHS